METPTGLKIILNTNLNVGNIDNILHGIYKVSNADSEYTF